MTKTPYNAFATIIDEIGRVKPYGNYSPAQPGDRVVGTASKFTLQLAAFVHKLKVEEELAQTRMKFALDRVDRQNVIEELFAIQMRLSAASSMYEIQIRGETKVWDSKLTLREGGQVVVTERDAQTSAGIAEKVHQAAEQGVEASVGGEPPNLRGRSRVMQFDLSQLGDLLGEGGIEALLGEGGLEAILGAGSPFANGDGRGARTSAL